MGINRLCIFLLLLTACITCTAQTDSAMQRLQQVPEKYIQQANKKIDQYTTRITSKTEKTLIKLSRWENKIKKIVEKASPETAQRLFGNDQLTFTTALEKYKKGEAVIASQRAKYDEYTDKLTTSLKYLNENLDSTCKNGKAVRKMLRCGDSSLLGRLGGAEANTEAMEQFIKERRKLLITEASKYLANTKCLQKISSETGLYIATLQNYKELFHDKKKAEETALTILNKIPAFTKFVQQNSYLAKLFGQPGGASSPLGAGGLAGLQTRASVNALIQNQIAAGGPSAALQIRQNMQDAQAQLSALKDKVLKTGGNTSGNDAIGAEYGKFPQQKTKTFLQRMKLGTDMSFVKDNSLMPTVANIAVNATYQLAANKEAGIGVAYKAGLGSINHIQITHQGIGLRSFVSLKLKNSFWLAGGWEANQNAGFKNITQLKDYSLWSQSALAGIEKKINVKTKLTKGATIKLMYDMMARQHSPVTQPVVFRVGYNF